MLCWQVSNVKNMLTERAKNLAKTIRRNGKTNLSPYDGHDTVGVVVLRQIPKAWLQEPLVQDYS